MGFKRGDTCFILQNNYRAVQAKVVSKQGRFYIIQLIGTCGAIRLPEDRLFRTEEDAMASRKTTRAIVSPQISVTSYTNPSQTIKMDIPDVFEGRRNNRSPHTVQK